MKKKILIFHPTIAPYRVDFFNAIDACSQMRLCLKYENLRDQHFNDYQDILSQCNFKPIYLKPLLTVGKRVFSQGIVSQIRDFDPDIVVGMEYALEVCVSLAYRRLCKKKYKVITICDDSYNMAAENNDFSKIHSVMRKLVAPRLDQIMLPSFKICEWYKDVYGKGLYFPIIRNEKKEIEKYVSALPISEAYADSYKLRGKAVFLYVGRLIKLKKIDDIINAFAMAKCDNSVLIIVGDGECENELKTLAINTPNVYLVGRMEGLRLIAWYNIASALVLASEREAFGAVVNEALLGGCNVIVSRECGSSCLAGNKGSVFNSGDVVSLANLMKKYSDLIVPDRIVLRKNNMNVEFDELFNSLFQQICAI